MGAAVRTRGRRGSTIVPNWRWEDADVDSYDLRVAGWLASHTDDFTTDHVSLTMVADRCHMSKDRASKSIGRLEQLGIVEVERGARDRLVITFDFDAWERQQADERPSATRTVTVRHAEDDRPPHGRSTGLHLPMGEEQGESQGVARVERSSSGLFEAFWRVYPRKCGKPAAEKAFKRAVASSDVHAIAAGLRAWCAYWEWRQQPEFIPHPSTWLNQHRWNDAPPPMLAAAPRAAGRPLTRMEQAYQRRTNCTDEQAREWSQRASEQRRGQLVSAEVVANAGGG